MRLHNKKLLSRDSTIWCLLAMGLIISPVEKARSASIEAEGNIIADGVSLIMLKNTLCNHLAQGVSPLPPLCSPLEAGEQLVFVTSTVSPTGANLAGWADNLGLPGTPFTDGLLAADAVCQHHADKAGLEGTYKAWLSTDTVNAKDRVGDHKWIRTDGVVVADSLADLLDCSNPDCLQSSISLTESGGTPPGNYVYTGTLSSGVSIGTGDCAAWTSSTDTSSQYYLGSHSTPAASWTEDVYWSFCDIVNYPLYCFGF